MLANTNLNSCNFSYFPVHGHNHAPPKIPSPQPIKPEQQKFPIVIKLSTRFYEKHCRTRTSCNSNWKDETGINGSIKLVPLQKLQNSFWCYSSLSTEENPENPILENEEICLEEENDANNGGGGGGGGERDWTTSLLLLGLYAGLVYYVVFLAPNQTPSTDVYFLKKLVNIIGDDGFQMNEVLVALWYILGLYPFVYSMLLLPTGRCENRSVPVWPFLILSGFAGLGLMAYAGLSDGAVWREFYQYFRASKFIHLTCIDFALLSTFAPFWVYNDMTARRWDNKGLWLLPLSLIPLVGPALYLILRPSLLAVPALLSSSTSEEK
ncbi:uncharacterized protein [Coffea arabica]|uniref:Uncharacterized protein isoform X5 n=1 Tax=Coffea arabica TaxID=13443 RepID=A0A6P6XHS7_COFAR|nr:uncharacterized protein LOC113743489 isoform X5 [Coffea arabica]